MGEFNGARVVVTGGAGFIGSHLVDALLSAGAERVAVVDNFFLGREANLAPAKALYGDVLTVYRDDAGDLDAMSAVCHEERPDVVFNLATKALLHSFFDPADAFRVNIDIATALGELLRGRAFDRLVHVSSSEVYGTALDETMSEEHQLRAETSYAAGKAAADLLLASYVNMFRVDVVTVRPFNNYGPRQNDAAYAAVIPLTMKRLDQGLSPLIEGDGLQTRDFVFVQDTVDAILRLASLGAASGLTFNLGSGHETSIREIVETLCEIYGYAGEVTWAPARVADVRRHCANVERAEALIGPVATIDLRSGLEQTFAWHQSLVAPEG